MAQKKSNLPIGYTPPKRGERIKASDIQGIAKAVKRLTRQGSEGYQTAFPLVETPFGLTIQPEPDDTYKVIVSRGYICERITVEQETENQTRYILPEGIALPPEDPIKHEIEVDQAVYVKFSTDKTGKIKDDPLPEIYIGEDTEAGASYYPAIGDYAGQEGEYLYKLAKFEIIDDSPRLKLFHSGDHIHHYAERVTMESVPVTGYTEDIRRVLKTYEPEADRVVFRSLKQSASAEGVPVIIELEPSETEATKETVDFVRIAGRDSSSAGAPEAQIEVVKDGIHARVQGNGKNGKRILRDTDGNIAWEIEWKDGLIVSEGIEEYQDQCSCSNNWNFNFSY
jgi:hypothetical protein